MFVKCGNTDYPIRSENFILPLKRADNNEILIKPVSI